ncbi:hypothetical protein [Cellulomonas sp. ATA003]|uniref:hypothetical protein n=1 Tax=Cellulomonas sp. ATA003 TaxID=3073064 RepID=UPI00287385D9|nr:hypothetical protein [Cellulomonas sp. ATA003]WNB86480.1 hypothetical protein REH70_04385 [Cellulomonas sp. ATA003]
MATTHAPPRPATRSSAALGRRGRRRDPWRALESSTAVWTGAVIGALALLNGDAAPVAAFSGLIVAFMLALSGCNVDSQDGSAVWQNVVGQDETSVRSDVRGRQWAMVLVFLPAFCWSPSRSWCSAAPGGRCRTSSRRPPRRSGRRRAPRS